MQLFLLWNLLLVWCFRWYLLLGLLLLQMTTWDLHRVLLTASFLFVLTFIPCLFPYGYKLVVGLVLYFCFYRIIQNLSLWTLVPGHTLLSVVFRGVCSNSLDILLLCLCHSYWTFPHVRNVIFYQQLLICNCFVCCFWMELVLQNPFVLPRLVL